MNFSRGEENLLELQIKAIAESGAKVIVAGSKFGDMAMHYLHKYGIMAVRLNSKFDLRRLSKTVIIDNKINMSCFDIDFFMVDFGKIDKFWEHVKTAQEIIITIFSLI